MNVAELFGFDAAELAELLERERQDTAANAAMLAKQAAEHESALAAGDAMNVAELFGFDAAELAELLERERQDTAANAAMLAKQAAEHESALAASRVVWDQQYATRSASSPKRRDHGVVSEPTCSLRMGGLPPGLLQQLPLITDADMTSTPTDRAALVQQIARFVRAFSEYQ